MKESRVLNLAGYNGLWFGILVSIGVSLILFGLGYFANRPSVLYAIPLGILVLGAAFRVTVRPRYGAWTVPLTLAGATMALVLVLLFPWLLRHNSRGFAVSIVASVYASRGSLDGFNIWYAHHTKYGPTISPAEELIYFRVVNTQAAPSTIQNYTVKLRTSWLRSVELDRMNLRLGQLLSGPVPDNSRPHGDIIIDGNVSLGGPNAVSGHAMSVLDLNGAALDRLLADHSLQANETVKGWAAFDVPQAYLKYLPHAWFILTITDDAGRNFTCGLPPRPGRTPYENQTSLENARLKILGETVDIRSFHRAFFSEVYPH